MCTFPLSKLSHTCSTSLTDQNPFLFKLYITVIIYIGLISTLTVSNGGCRRRKPLEVPPTLSRPTDSRRHGSTSRTRLQDRQDCSKLAKLRSPKSEITRSFTSCDTLSKIITKCRMVGDSYSERKDNYKSASNQDEFQIQNQNLDTSKWRERNRSKLWGKIRDRFLGNGAAVVDRINLRIFAKNEQFFLLLVNLIL